MGRKTIDMSDINLKHSKFLSYCIHTMTMWPQASSYCYLGIDFTSDGGWDTHVKRVISNGRKKVNQLHSIISNRNINLTA